MKVLLFEWLTGGGLWVDQRQPDAGCSTQRQGWEMMASMAVDFRAAGIEIVVPIDDRLGEPLQNLPADINVLPIRSADDLVPCLTKYAAMTDYIMLIAPECDMRLLKCVHWMDRVCDKLISPNAQFVEIASCKLLTTDYFQSQGIEALPHGMRLSTFTQENWRQRVKLPAVLKPIDGAGGEDVRLITHWSELDIPLAKPADQYRIERFVTGVPVSVSVLCGETSQILTPTGQIFDREPFGNYVGAQYPLAPGLSDRAIRLAEAAIKALPETKGYVGIDMIISDTAEEFDCLIEVNPRLTMSYLKLREIYKENLAMLMLETACPSANASVKSPVNPRCIFRSPNP